MKYLKNIFSQGLWKEEEGIKRGWGEEKKVQNCLGNPKCQESLFGHQIHAIIINILFALIRANIFN